MWAYIVSGNPEELAAEWIEEFLPAALVCNTASDPFSFLDAVFDYADRPYPAPVADADQERVAFEDAIFDAIDPALHRRPTIRDAEAVSRLTYGDLDALYAAYGLTELSHVSDVFAETMGSIGLTGARSPSSFVFDPDKNADWDKKQKKRYVVRGTYSFGEDAVTIGNLAHTNEDLSEVTYPIVVHEWTHRENLRSFLDKPFVHMSICKNMYDVFADPFHQRVLQEPMSSVPGAMRGVYKAVLMDESSEKLQELYSWRYHEEVGAFEVTIVPDWNDGLLDVTWKRGTYEEMFAIPMDADTRFGESGVARKDIYRSTNDGIRSFQATQENVIDAANNVIVDRSFGQFLLRDELIAQTAESILKGRFDSEDDGYVHGIENYYNDAANYPENAGTALRNGLLDMNDVYDAQIGSREQKLRRIMGQRERFLEDGWSAYLAGNIPRWLPDPMH